jgi:hypothetical protein
MVLSILQPSRCFCDFVVVYVCGRNYFMLIYNFSYKKQTPWSESASELYRPSDRRLSSKWLPTFLRIEGATWSAWQIPTAVFCGVNYDWLFKSRCNISYVLWVRMTVIYLTFQHYLIITYCIRPSSSLKRINYSRSLHEYIKQYTALIQIQITIQKGDILVKESLNLCVAQWFLN